MVYWYGNAAPTPPPPHSFSPHLAQEGFRAVFLPWMEPLPPNLHNHLKKSPSMTALGKQS